jgi:hypothetical protein
LKSKPSKKPAFVAACCRLISFLAYASTLKMKVYVPPKHHSTFMRLHGIISQMNKMFTVIAVRTLNPEY